MEYAVPRDQLSRVLAEIDAWLESSGEHVPFPVEVRFAAADDLWLSTAHGRETAYIAVHQYVRRPFERYFRAVERIVARSAAGRTGARCTGSRRTGSASSTRGSPTPSASARRPTRTASSATPTWTRLFGA